MGLALWYFLRLQPGKLRLLPRMQVDGFFFGIRALVASIALVACQRPAPVAPSGSPPATAVVRTVTLRGGAVRVVVEHDGEEAWATYVADHAVAYLPAAERYLDRSFADVAAGFFQGTPPPWTVRIHGQRTVMLGDVHIGAYNNSAGIFGPDRGIFVEYGLARVGDPALVLHELTHYFFLGSGAALVPGAMVGENRSSWFIEGVCSMTPIALASAGLMPLGEGEEHAMRMHWGQWGVPAAARDVPIQRDTRREGDIPLFYGKSFRVELILQRELGDRYRTLLRRAAKQRNQTSDEVLALLAAEDAEVDWRALLRGWVFPGAYGKYAPADVPGFLPFR